ncbi:YfhO family protein [Nostoc calcicola FACHB-3891]|nr:YfhO family protein [Nostoc calcicola FACHB-3891]
MKYMLLKVKKFSLNNHILILVWLALLGIMLTSRVIISGDRTILAGFDNSVQFYAWYTHAARAISQGTLPLWDFYQLSGHSFIGEMQAGLFYPPNLVLFWVLSLLNPESYTITAPPVIEFFVLIGLIGCAFASYWMFQEFNLSKPASLIGATIFAYAGFTFARQSEQLCVFNSIIWIPFIVAAYLRYSRQDSILRKLWWLNTSGFGLAMAILAGHYLGFIYAAAIITFYSIFKIFRQIQKNNLDAATRKNIITKAIALFITIAFGILLASLQLIPTLEYSKLSLRWVSGPNPVSSGEKIPYSVLADQFHFTPAGLFSTINPDFVMLNFPINIDGQVYSGIIALLLGLFVIWKLKNSNDNVLFFSIIFVFSIIYSLGGDSLIHSVYNILSPISDPVRTSSRISCLSHFAISGLAACGIDYLWKLNSEDVNSKNLFNNLIKVCLGIIFLFLLSIPFLSNDKYSLINSLLMTLYLTVISLYFIKSINRQKPYNRRLIIILLSLLIIQDTYYFYIKRLPQRVYDPPQLLYPSQVVKVHAPVLRNLEGVNSNYRIANFKPDEIKNFGDALGIKMMMGHGASMPKNYFNFLGDLGWNNQRINDILGAKYIINTNPKDSKAPVQVTENRSALPIYRIYRSYEVVSQHNGAIAMLKNEKFDYKSTVILNKQPNFKSVENTALSLQTLAPEEVTLQAQYPNQVKLLAKSQKPAILVFADQIYPGWSAFVNDVKVPVMEADTLFKAVVIPAGISTVVFQYRPTSFTIGLIISCLVAICYLLISLKNLNLISFFKDSYKP